MSDAVAFARQDVVEPGRLAQCPFGLGREVFSAGHRDGPGEAGAHLLDQRAGRQPVL
jgi:hypothetical protein